MPMNDMLGWDTRVDCVIIRAPLQIRGFLSELGVLINSCSVVLLLCNKCNTSSIVVYF